MTLFNNYSVTKSSGFGKSKKYCPKCYYLKYKVIKAFLDGRQQKVTRQCDGCYFTWDVNCREEYNNFK